MQVEPKIIILYINSEPHQRGCWCLEAAVLSPGTSAASLWTLTEHRRSHLQNTRDMKAQTAENQEESHIKHTSTTYQKTNWTHVLVFYT